MGLTRKVVSYLLKSYLSPLAAVFSCTRAREEREELGLKAGDARQRKQKLTALHVLLVLFQRH